MERHEIDDELASTGAQQLLTPSSMARLAYLATDATPRVIPIGYYWTGYRRRHGLSLPLAWLNRVEPALLVGLGFVLLASAVSR